MLSYVSMMEAAVSVRLNQGVVAEPAEVGGTAEKADVMVIANMVMER